MTQLSDLLNTNKLPDINWWNAYKTQNAASLDSADTDAAYRQFVEGHAAVIRENAAKTARQKNTVDAISNLIVSMGNYKEQKDATEKKRIKRETINRMKEGREGTRRATYAEKYGIDKLDFKTDYTGETASLPPWDVNLKVTDDNISDIIEYNTLSKNIRGEIDTLPDGWERTNLQFDDSLKVAESVYSYNAKTLVETTKTLLMQLKDEPFFVEGFSETNGVISLRDAIANREVTLDGESVSEAIRDEIYSEIFYNLGGHQIPYSILEDQYYPEILKDREITTMQEGVEARRKSDEAYESKEQEEFFLGITGTNVARYIAGTPQLKGTDGILYQYQGRFDTNYAVDKIIDRLDKAKNDLTTSDLTAIIGGQYYHKGSKEPVSLEKLNKKLYRRVNTMLKTSNSDLAEERTKFVNYFESKYTPIFQDAYNKWRSSNENRIPTLKEVTDIQVSVLEQAKNDEFFQTSPTGRLYRDRLGIASEDVNKLLSTVSYREEQNDRDIKHQIQEARQNADWNKAARLTSQLSNPASTELNPQGLTSEKAKVAMTEIEKGITGKDGVNEMVEKYISPQEADIQAHWLRRQIKEQAQAKFKQLYSDYWEVDPAAALRQALTETEILLKKGEFENPPKDNRITKKGETEALKRNIEKTKKLYESYDNKFDFLYSDESWPGEINSLNYGSANPGVVPPLYQQVAKFFDGLNGEDIYQIRLGKHHRMEYTDAEKKAFYDTYSYTDIDGKFVPFNVEEQAWFNKKAIGKNMEIIDKNQELRDKQDEELLNSEEDPDAVWTKEQTLKGRRNLNNRPLGNSLLQYVVNSKDINFIFNTLKNKRAFKNGTEYNYIVDPGGKQIKLEKPLERHTYAEIKDLLEFTPVKEIGGFGMSLPEIKSVIDNMDFDEDTQLFDQSFQEELMWERMKLNVNKKNELSIHDFPRLTRHNKTVREKFLELVTTGKIGAEDYTVTGNYIGDDFKNYIPIVDSVWNRDIELLSPAIVDKVLERTRQRVRNMDDSNQGTVVGIANPPTQEQTDRQLIVENKAKEAENKRINDLINKEKAKQSAIEQLLKQPKSEARDRAIKAIQGGV